MKKWVAVSLVSALALTAPGLPCYAAAGAVLGKASSPARSARLVLPERAPLSGPRAAGLMGTLPRGLDALPKALPDSPLPAQAPSAAPRPINAAGQLRVIAQDGVQTLPKAGTGDLDGLKTASPFDGARPNNADAAEAFGRGVAQGGSLAPPFGFSGGDSAVVPPAPPSPGTPRPGGDAPRPSKLLGFLKSIATVALAGGGVWGLHWAATALLPAVFGLAPMAAVWAVMSGALFLPPALFARYRLSRHDSPRLKWVKRVLDLSIGAYLGGLAVAAPSFSWAVSAYVGSAAAPLAAAAGVGTLVTATSGGRIADSLLAGGALVALPAVLGSAFVSALGLGPLAGMLALPVMTTVTFFLKQIIDSAEKGEPFSVPGMMQKIRFPAFNWIMLGVVFALTTGYGAARSDLGFMAWMFLGNRTGAKWDKTKPLWRNLLNVLLNFNALYLGLLVFCAATGFSSPLTFLILAFAPERAAHWAERLLGRLLPKSEPAPSTAPRPAAEDLAFAKEPQAPRFHYWAKTFTLLGLMLALGFVMAAGVFGVGSLLKNLAVASALAAIPFFFSNWLIKKMMQAEPADEENEPEFFAIMKELRERINARRAKEGKKPIPMPEMVTVPMEVPNAFATGRSPFHATVGVTVEIKKMLLEPENARKSLRRLMDSAQAESPAFKAFRAAIAGSGIKFSPDAGPAEVSQAIERADRAQLKDLGARMLRGVLGHEFSHVLDRHMLTGSIGGAISSGVAFASWGAMWGLAHARAIATGLEVRASALKDRLLRRPRPSAPPAERARARSDAPESEGAKPEFVEPVTAAAAAKALPVLLKLFSLIWGPLILQITQLAGSRNNEGQADEDGAYLTEDPAALALALGMLTTWKPPKEFLLEMRRMPKLAAVSHLMTVNPLQQLDQAQALPKLDPAVEWVTGKGESFLFDLFMTHPDTRVRIERLEKIRAGPALGGGGNLSPPLALGVLPASPAPSRQSRGGLFRRAWRKAAGLFRVFPEKDSNFQFWVKTSVDAGISLGYYFMAAALATWWSTALIAYNRAINWGTQAVASITTGPMVDRTKVEKIMAWTYFGRAVLMMFVPILFFHGWLWFGVFLALTTLSGPLVSMGANASGVAFNRILGSDEAHYNKANAVSDLIMNLAGILGPLAAGTFIGMMDLRYGPLAGNALAYGVYSLILFAGAAVLFFFLRVPRTKLLKAREDLAKRLANELHDRRIKGVIADREDSEDGGKPREVLKVEVSGDPSAVQVPYSEFAGYPVQVVAKRRVFRQLIGGLRLVSKDDFFRLYLLFGTLGWVAGDSLVFTVLPRYIKDVLGHADATVTFFHSVPWLDSIIQALTSTPGAFGIYLATASLGSALASLVMVFFRDKALSALLALQPPFQRRLKLLEPSLTDDQLLIAAAAIRKAPAAVLESYVQAWRENPAAQLSHQDFARAVMRETQARLSSRVFAGAKTAAQLERVLADTGLDAALLAWSARHFDKLAKDARFEARTGLDPLQRQARWSSVLHGISWLAYGAVFLAPSLWPSVGAMLLALLLSGPAQVIWASVTQMVMKENHPGSMGMIIGAVSFYTLLYSVAGILIFGWMLTALPTMTAIWITVAVASACFLLDVIAPFAMFPIHRRPDHGPKG